MTFGGHHLNEDCQSLCVYKQYFNEEIRHNKKEYNKPPCRKNYLQNNMNK